MRSLVGIITTIATVIHFTFGCCLHPCHVGGRGDCMAHAIEAIECDACCHDHEEAAPEPNDGQCILAEFSLSATRAPVNCHDCEGCHCAAITTETVRRVPWSPLASGIVAAHDGEAITLFAVTCGRQSPDPHTHQGASRLALLERFLI